MSDRLPNCPVCDHAAGWHEYDTPDVYGVICCAPASERCPIHCHVIPEDVWRALASKSKQAETRAERAEAERDELRNKLFTRRKEIEVLQGMATERDAAEAEVERLRGIVAIHSSGNDALRLPGVLCLDCASDCTAVGAADPDCFVPKGPSASCRCGAIPGHDGSAGICCCPPTKGPDVP